MNLELFRWLVLVLACAPFVYYLMCVVAAARFLRRAGRRNQSANDFAPPISILKPVRGLDRNALENFRSYCSLDYPDYELVFCVEGSDAPAVPLICDLVARHPRCKIRLLTDTEPLGVNPKVNKLARLVREARYDLLVMTDSDVRVEPGYLRSIARVFANPKVGAATVLFRSDVDGSLVSILDCIGSSCDFWASTLVSRHVEDGLRFTHGATMAVRRALLAEIGGWESRVNHHSDDHWLGEQVAARGYKVALIDDPIWMVYPSQTLAEHLRHEALRLIRIRSVRPWGYFGLLATQGLFWALAAMAVAPSAAIAAAYLVTYLTLRSLMVWVIGVQVLRDPVMRRKWWLAPLRDAVGFYVWLMGFFSNRIVRRGIEFRSLEGGRLVRIEPRSVRRSWRREAP